MNDTVLAAPDPSTRSAPADEWALGWRGREWSSQDLTGDHLAVVAELLGVAPGWSVVDVRAMHPALGPLQTMALIAAFVIVADEVRGMSARQAVLDIVRGASVAELLGAIRVREE